jgi:hypothetical protein
LQLIALGLTAWVAALVVRRKLHREFPFFFAYLILSVIVPLVRLSVSGDYVTFFIVFWATEALYALVALLALYEVFHEVFLPFYLLWWWFWLLFPGAAIFIAFLSVRNALHNPLLRNPRPIEIIFALATGVNYMEAAIFGLFFVLVLLLGIRWKSYPFGIVEGFGLYALGGLLAYGLRSEFGTKYTTVVKYSLPVAYLVGVLAWLLTFLGPPDPEVVHAWRDQVTPEQFLAQARVFVRITKRYFGGKR